MVLQQEIPLLFPQGGTVDVDEGIVAQVSPEEQDICGGFLSRPILAHDHHRGGTVHNALNLLPGIRQKAVIETVIDQVKGRVPVYAGTGCISTTDAIYMSKRAEQMGADVLSIITPSFALASQKELYDHHVAVAKHVNIPIVLYNIPARTGNKLLPETVQALCRDVDVIMGAKDSSGDLENLKAYIRLTQELPKKVAILAGNDGNILNCLKAGGIAGRANLYPATVASIYDKFVAGDIEGAEAAQQSITGIQRAMKLGNPNTVIKLATRMLGNPVGEPRRPFNYLCPEGLEVLKEVLAEDAKLGLH